MGRCFRHCGQQTDHGGEEQEPLGVGVGGLRRREVRNSAGQGRNQSGEFGPMFFDVGEELVLGSVRDVVPECFGEELVGSGEVLLAVTEQHTGPVVEAARAASATRVVLPRPASPETSSTSRPSPPATRFVASVMACISASRPTTPTAGRTARRPGRGMRGPGVGSVLRGAPTAPRRSRPGRASPSGSVPRVSGIGAGCDDPAVTRTMSAAKTCPLSQVAQSRAASTTGSPK